MALKHRDWVSLKRKKGKIVYCPVQCFPLGQGCDALEVQ